MSVTVRRYRRGGWEVDILFRLPEGTRHRERSRAPASSKSAALRWGEDRVACGAQRLGRIPITPATMPSPMDQNKISHHLLLCLL